MSLRSSIEHENGELRHAGMDSRHLDSQGCLQRNPCQPGLQQSMPECWRFAKISDDADHSFNETPFTLTICPFSSLPRDGRGLYRFFVVAVAGPALFGQLQ